MDRVARAFNLGPRHIRNGVDDLPLKIGEGDLVVVDDPYPADAGRREILEEGRAKPAATYAKRFAAKEACAKALGTGFSRGVFMKDMGVVNLPSGAPTLALSGGAKARLDAITPQGHRAVIHLTLTDDHPMAMAVVMIEALPDV